MPKINCSICENVKVDMNRGVCDKCEDMLQHRAWRENIEDMKRKEEKQIKVDSLIERIPELIALLGK